MGKHINQYEHARRAEEQRVGAGNEKISQVGDEKRGYFF